MDWPNERFVKLYTRDTDDWLLLCWQARAVFPLVMRKVDRAGVLETKRGSLGVAALVGLPLEVVDPAVAALLADGCLVEHTRGYLVRNFLEAQDAAQSDKLRAAASRERRRLGVTSGHAASHEVTNRDDSVTNRDQTSRGVTSGHAASLQTSQTDDPERDAAAVAAAPPKVRRRPATELPEGWTPDASEANAKAASEARARGLDLARELEKFRDYAAANDWRKQNWDATWRNWTRNSKSTANGSGLGSRTPAGNRPRPIPIA